MMRTPPVNYSSVDWCAVLREVGAVGDVPVPALFPFLFAAHSDAIVLLTVRDSMTWVTKRVEWGREGGDAAAFVGAPRAHHARPQNSWSDPAPFGWLTWHSAGSAYGLIADSAAHGEKVQNIEEYAGHLGVAAAAWTHFAQMALVACLVPPQQLTVINFFDEGGATNSSGGGADAEHWRLIGAAVNRSWLLPADPGRFPRFDGR